MNAIDERQAHEIPPPELRAPAVFDDLLRERSPLVELLERDYIPKSRLADEQARAARLARRAWFTEWVWPLHSCNEVAWKVFWNEPLPMDWTVYRECLFIGHCPPVFQSKGSSFGVVTDSIFQPVT